MTAHDVARVLPDIPRLRDLCRSLAVLEAILSPEWESRYYSFDAAWSPEEEMASMRNGSGDGYFIVFSAAGAYICGFDHESAMSPYRTGRPWPGVFDAVPEVFRPCVEEASFGDPHGKPLATACLWRETSDDQWRVGEIDYPQGESDPDGAARMFSLPVEPSSEAYQRFAEHYYEVAVDLEAVRHVYELRPLAQGVVSSLNSDVLISALGEDLAAARYPVAAG